MPTRNKKPDKPLGKPATTLQGRENQMVALAEELAERQLADGTASAQVISHYLKLGSTREILEQERLIQENELLKARVEQLGSNKRIEELYTEAMKAFSTYSGQDPEDYED